MVNKQYLWLDGKFVAFEDAKVHILTHSLQYGSGIFEGIRIYDTAKGPAIFRLHDHLLRFERSAKIYDMKLRSTLPQLEKAIPELVKMNGLRSGYIRPFGFVNDQHIGIDTTGKPISVAIAAVEFGTYYKNKDKGIKCWVTSWRRINSDILPPQAKASGNYLNSRIASEEAKAAGADEAILLSKNGYVAEGTADNVFLVKDGVLITPSVEADILMGITRDTVIKIAKTKGIPVEERMVHREELYTADEVFFTGTAAEVTPIDTVDRKKIGEGRMGPITKQLSSAYTDIVSGKNAKTKAWLTYV